MKAEPEPRKKLISMEKKVLFFSPYMPTHFGGGEKYILDCARIAASFKNTQAYVGISTHLWKNEEEIKTSYEKFLNQNLEKIKFIPCPLATKSNPLAKYLWTGQFDIVYYLTDGSLFFSKAKKNILHVQIPFTNPQKSFLSKLKLRNWHIKNTNSNFTKSIVSVSWNTNFDLVHNPLIEYEGKSPVRFEKKKKQIISVGRFFRQLHSKRQDVMVEIFKQICDHYPKEVEDWELVLIGGVEDKEFANEVKKAAKKYPIRLLHNVSREELWQYYQDASIYWHATGYGVHQSQAPEKVEHFGISTVEAMSAGCVPIVINKGGQPEIVGETLSSLLWNSQEELIATTIAYIKNPAKRKKMGKYAQSRSLFFGKKRFTKQLQQMLEIAE